MTLIDVFLHPRIALFRYSSLSHSHDYIKCRIILFSIKKIRIVSILSYSPDLPQIVPKCPTLPYQKFFRRLNEHQTDPSNVKNLFGAPPAPLSLPMPAPAALLHPMVVLPLVRKRIPSVVGFAQDLSRKAHGLFSKNFAAPAIARAWTTCGWRWCHRGKVGVHFDVRQMALKRISNYNRSK